MNYGKNEGSSLHSRIIGDGVVEVIIYKDELHLDCVYLQANRNEVKKSIPEKLIKEFVGVLKEKGASMGVFVSTGEFTAGARDYANSSPRRFELIDGSRLTDLLIKYSAGVRVEQTIILKGINDEYFDNLE